MGLTVNQWLAGFDSLMRSQEQRCNVTYNSFFKWEERGHALG